MKVVFDASMASCAVREGCGREPAGGDIGSLFGLDLIAALDAALDHGNSGELREAGRARIGALRGLPVDDMGDRIGADLDAAVANRLDPLDLAGRRCFEIALDVGMQGRLVVLHG